MKSSAGTPSILELSNQLAAAVAQAAESTVAVHARPRLASTGVHWRDGLIVTTNATVRRDHDIHITLADGRRVPATVQGRDARTDLAVLKTDQSDLPAPTFGDPLDLQPGHIVLALARLDDSGPRVSFGAVSAVGGEWRTWKGGEYDRRLQSGLVLHPGFGGGPLIDAAGRVHGINSGGLSRQFATTIPVKTVDEVLGQLVAKGHVPRGWLGVAMQLVRVTPQTSKALGLTNEGGLLIVSIADDGPAANAGLLVGDIILAMDGNTVGDPDDLRDLSSREAVGRRVAFDLVRGGARARVDVVVSERPRDG